MRGFLLVIGLFFASPAAAQDPMAQFVGRPVTAVHLEIEGQRAEAPELRALIEVRVGDRLDLAMLRSSLMQLFSGGRCEDIHIVGTETGAGVELVFDIVPLHTIDNVEFRGMTGLSHEALRKAVEQRFNGLPDNSQVDAASRAVERALADEGYRQATARAATVNSHAPERSSLVITVDAGPLTTVTRATVEGTSPLSDAEVLRRAGVIIGGAYRSRAIDLALDGILDTLRGKDHYSATVSHARDKVSEDGRTVDVVIDVNAGPLVTLAFAGDPLPSGNVADLVPIKREGSADDDLLEDAERRIEAGLRRAGYWKAQASYARKDGPGGSVITFTVARGPRYRFERLDVAGNTRVTTEIIANLIDLAPGALFDESKVARGVQALRELYLAQGFAAATITPAPEELPAALAGGDPRVVEHLVIVEGNQTRVTDVRISGAQLMPEAELIGLMRLKSGEPFVASHVPADRMALATRYLDRGYAGARVDVRPQISADGTTATILVDVVEGPQTIVDRIIIVGNKKVSERTIRDAIVLVPGQPLGLAAQVATQQKLVGLGFFRRINIREAPTEGGESRVDVIIAVEEAPTTNFVYGGGVESALRSRTVAIVDGEKVQEDRLEVAPRASIQLDRTNLWGKNRTLSFFGGVSLRPIDDTDNPARDGKCCGFSEYRAITTLREPRVFGLNADGALSVSAEQAIRQSFNFFRQDVSAQVLRRLTPRVTFIGRYSLQQVRLYEVKIREEDQLLVDRLFPRTRLSVFSTSVLRDTRSDAIAPVSGSMLSVDGDLAARAYGSQFGFARAFAQAFRFYRLPNARRVVLAGAARLGLLRGFVRTVEKENADGTLERDANGNVVTARVEDVHISQRFFAGGSNTSRGFRLDRLAVPEILTGDGFSNGGNGLLLFNAEARLTITRELGLVAFLDTGNVYSRVSTIDLGKMRSSIGAGVRYRSPIGPLRLDFAWKVGALRATDARRWEYHFSIGEAF